MRPDKRLQSCPPWIGCTRDTIQSKPAYHQGVQTAWEGGLRSTRDAGPGEPIFAWKESSEGIAQQCSQHGGWKLVLELLHLMRITLGTWQIFLKENKNKLKGEIHKILSIYIELVDFVSDNALTNHFHQNSVLIKTVHESKCLNFGQVITIALKNLNNSKCSACKKFRYMYIQMSYECIEGM